MHISVFPEGSIAFIKSCPRSLRSGSPPDLQVKPQRRPEESRSLTLGSAGLPRPGSFILCGGFATKGPVLWFFCNFFCQERRRALARGSVLYEITFLNPGNLAGRRGPDPPTSAAPAWGL